MSHRATSPTSLAVVQRQDEADEREAIDTAYRLVAEAAATAVKTPGLHDVHRDRIDRMRRLAALNVRPAVVS